MRTAFFVIILLHAFIHIIGFTKAFEFADINQITHHITRFSGTLWLTAFILLLSSGFLFIFNNEYWWLPGLAGVILSQILVIMVWSDAKFGSIPNLIIFLTALIALADWNFARTIDNETADMLNQSVSVEIENLTEDMIGHLPAPVRKWLISSGAVGKEMIQTVKLRQRGQMKMKPEQNDWYLSDAVQHFTTGKPAFIWKVEVKYMPALFFTGRDYFRNGKGGLLIKALSLFNVANEKDNKRLNQGTLQRYLGEIVWFPTAAVSPYIKWEEVDSLTAKATMSYMETTGSAYFHFNDSGDPVKFSTMRYMDSKDISSLTEWVITLSEMNDFNGIRIPVKGEATWKLNGGDFTWYKLEVYDVEFNRHN